MPKSLWNAPAREELLARLDRLTPDATPLWGRMTAPEMLAHLTGWMLMIKGDLPIKPRNLIIRHTPIKQLLIYWLPFPKGVPTAKELIGRTQLDWSVEKAEIRRHIESFESNAGRTLPDHPAFGALTPAAWGVLGYRHTDHHLRQFGV